jgi:uncharacterized membrane protein
MNLLRTALLLAATLSTGLMAGVFGLYSHTIMPGLATVDDRTFVAGFGAVDRAITNPWFLGGGFLGAVVFGAAAALTHWGRATMPWVLAAVALYLVVVVVTAVVNVPLNEGLKAAGDAQQLTDPAAVRERFDEVRWMRWNLVRTLLTTVAFGLLAWSLVLHGHADTLGGG